MNGPRFSSIKYPRWRFYSYTKVVHELSGTLPDSYKMDNADEA
jgi:hypothetical protein